MKAYDVMKLAAENPQKYEGKRYKVRDTLIDRHGREYETAIFKSGDLRVCGDNLLFAHVNSKTELEEIPQPVPFLEAVKAKGKDGGRIICNYKGVTKEYGGVAFTTIDYGEPVTFDEILHGGT